VAQSAEALWYNKKLSNVQILDETTGNQPVAAVALDYGLTDTVKHQVEISGLFYQGTNNPDHLVSMNSLGVTQDVLVEFSNIFSDLDDGVFYCNGSPDQLRSTYRNFNQSSGSDVPVAVRVSGNFDGVYGLHEDLGGNTGLSYQNGKLTGTAGLSKPNFATPDKAYGIQYPGGPRNGVSSYVLAAGTLDLDLTDSHYNGQAYIKIFAERQDIFLIATTAGNTITDIAAGASVTTSSTGTEPAGTNNLRVWKSGNTLKTKNNTTANFMISILYEG
jgi:hypothetical protein